VKLFTPDDRERLRDRLLELGGRTKPLLEFAGFGDD